MMNKFFYMENSKGEWMKVQLGDKVKFLQDKEKVKAGVVGVVCSINKDMIVVEVEERKVRILFENLENYVDPIEKIKVKAVIRKRRRRSNFFKL